jgi:hypothetical protein
MFGWHLRIFDNPHIPEGVNAGGDFMHQLYFGEEYVALGLFTPVAVTTLLGAMALWAKLYKSKRLVLVPACGLAIGMIAVTVIASVTHQVIMAGLIMAVCTVVPAACIALLSPYRPLLWNWSQDWNRDLDHGV